MKVSAFLSGKGKFVAIGILSIVVFPLFLGLSVAVSRNPKFFVSKFLFSFLLSSALGSSLLNNHWRNSPNPKKFDLHEKAYFLVIVGWIIQSFGNSFWHFVLLPTTNGFIIFFIIEAIILTDFIKLCDCQLKPKLFLLLIGYPSIFFFTLNLLTVPMMSVLLIVDNYTFSLYFFMTLSVICAISVFITTHSRKAKNYAKVPIDMGKNKKSIKPLQRITEKQKPESKNCLRIIQLTDVHIGPIMSVARLQYICKQTIALKPDLIVLTGDFFTVQAYGGGHGVGSNSFSLKDGLSPLIPYAKICVACLGNHDKEGDFVKTKTREVLAELGIKLLVDEQLLFDSRIGKIQIIGFDYKIRKNFHTPEVTAKFPRDENSVLRLMLLHDPGGFKFIPENDDSLVLSGHTHGGQIGWIWGFNFSLVSLIIPDNGLWGNGLNRLYVHRGQGCRTLLGSALARVGIPPEDSVLEVYV